jgi:ribosomal protein S18 acetylase RimI-like enzyme
MAELVIRPATGRDEPALLLLAARLAEFELPRWRTPSSVVDADAQAMLVSLRAKRQEDVVFVAEREGKPVGCLHVLATTDFFGLPHAHVSVIATSATAEGSGVGTALLEHAEAWARSRELPLMTLNVFAANTRACQFYERAGMNIEFVKYAKPIGTDRT